MEDDKVFDLLTKMYGEINNRFDKLENKVNKVNEDVSTLKGDVSTLKGDVSKIGIQIEGTIIPKQQALFDGYSANTEKLSELANNLDDVKFDVNNISIRTLKNENSFMEVKKIFGGKA